MKVRSKALYAYLLEADVLTKTPAEIDCAKREYRKLYKKRWRQNKRPRKEIRIEFTQKQFTEIKAKARWYQLRHTTYAMQVILAAIESGLSIVPQREQLEKILHLVSMASIVTERNAIQRLQVPELLQEVETILMDYLNSNY